MKIKGFLLAGAAGAAVSPAAVPAVATAADMMLKAPPPPPAPALWTGWYVGVNAGAAYQTARQTYDFTGCCLEEQRSGSKISFIGGGQIGYNWQAGSVVYSIEGDFSGLSGKVTDFGATQNGSNYSSRISWLATVRGRLGVAFGNTMPYVTAGLAIAGVNNKAFNIDGISELSYSDTHTRLGLAVGGGVEHMINRNWTIKLEALWVGFDGTRAVQTNFKNTSRTFGFGAQTATIGRVGLNYRF